MRFSAATMYKRTPTQGPLYGTEVTLTSRLVNKDHARFQISFRLLVRLDHVTFPPEADWLRRSDMRTF